MDKKNYTLSKVIDFVTKGEDSSNVDSDEEEKIVILPSTESAEAETDWDSDISDDKNEGIAHHMPCRLLTALHSTNTVKQNLDESNQTSDDESYKHLPKRQKQNKKKSWHWQCSWCCWSTWVTSKTIWLHKNTLWCFLEYLLQWSVGYNYYPNQHIWQQPFFQAYFYNWKTVVKTQSWIE